MAAKTCRGGVKTGDPRLLPPFLCSSAPSVRLFVVAVVADVVDVVLLPIIFL